MRYQGITKDGVPFPADALIGMPERAMLWQVPNAWKIIDLETEEVVWTRTIAFEPGTYDPGSKVLPK